MWGQWDTLDVPLRDAGSDSMLTTQLNQTDGQKYVCKDKSRTWLNGWIMDALYCLTSFLDKWVRSVLPPDRSPFCEAGSAVRSLVSDAGVKRDFTLVRDFCSSISCIAASLSGESELSFSTAVFQPSHSFATIALAICRTFFSSSNGRKFASLDDTHSFRRRRSIVHLVLIDQEA